MNTTFKLIMRPLTSRVARKVIEGRLHDVADSGQGRFSRDEVSIIIRETWHMFDELGPDAKAPTVGARLNLKLARLTFAFFHALLDFGISHAQAIELTSKLTWAFYKRGAMGSKLLHGEKSRAGLGFMREADVTKLEAGAVVPLGFPFNPPGYIARNVPIPNGIGFDIVKCPVAEFFRAYDAGDLCQSSWCNLDFPLAELMGQKLTHDRTIAGGGGRCTFRITPLEHHSTQVPERREAWRS